MTIVLSHECHCASTVPVDDDLIVQARRVVLTIGGVGDGFSTTRRTTVMRRLFLVFIVRGNQLFEAFLRFEKRWETAAAMNP